jgi:hypothetical protein
VQLEYEIIPGIPGAILGRYLYNQLLRAPSDLHTNEVLSLHRIKTVYTDNAHFRKYL